MTGTTMTPPVRNKRPRISLYALRAFLVLHSGLVILQPIMAGIYLAGENDAMNVHSPIGSTLWMITLLQFPVTLLYWRPGGGRLLPFWVTLGVFVAEFVQLILGSTHQVAFHIPLGTLIVTAVVWLTIWSFRDIAKQPRPSVVARSKNLEVPA